MATSKTDPVSDLLNPVDAELRGLDDQLTANDVREGAVPTRNTGALDTDNITDMFGIHRFLGSENAPHVRSNCPSIDNKGTTMGTEPYQYEDDLDEFIDWHREVWGVQPQEEIHFPTWFGRQRARLGQLEAAPTRPLTREERQGLEQRLVVGPSVLVCEMPVPPDEYLIAFAMNTPAANVLFGAHPNVAVRMVSRMGMQTAKHPDASVLIARHGIDRVPLLLFCAVRRPWRPAQVRLASIALAGSARWYTNIGSAECQILLVHHVGDLDPRLKESEQLEYLLAWPMIGATED